jgi:ABC-2 type transport system permease protein
MTSMTALMKREFLDHKGAMFWAQLVIGALLTITIIWGAASISMIGKGWTNVHIGIPPAIEVDGTVKQPDGTTVTRSTRKLEDGREEVTITMKDKSGKQTSEMKVNRAPGGPIADVNSLHINGESFTSPKDALQSLNKMPAEERETGAHMLSSGLFTGTAVVPLLVALVMVPFILLASLYDERQDRSILFWKSLPVTDTKVVLAKLAYGTLLTFGIAFLIAMVVHLIGLASASLVGGRYGVMGVGHLWHVPTLLNTWGTWLLVVFQYVLWALPVYAWFLLVSAAAPRAPFLFAFMIPAAIGMMEGLVNKSGFFAAEFFGRLGAAPLVESVQALSINSDNMRAPEQFLAVAQKAVFDGFTRADLWIGIAFAAVMVYAAIEIRRRKTV